MEFDKSDDNFAFAKVFPVKCQKCEYNISVNSNRSIIMWKTPLKD